MVAQSECAAYHAAVASFGARLRELRQKRGLSQEKLALKLGQKRPSSVQGWERGKLPKPSTIVAIARVLSVEPSELLSGVVTEYDRHAGTTTG